MHAVVILSNLTDQSINQSFVDDDFAYRPSALYTEMLKQKHLVLFFVNLSPISVPFY